MLPPEGDDFEKVLHEASARWSQLQANLDEAEDVFLTQRGDLFRKWFALEDADLTVRTEGGLRHTIHDRVQRLVLAPLADKMRQRVGFVSSTDDSGDAEEQRAGRTQLQELLDFWHQRLKPVIDEAKSEDDKLSKKIRKTEKEERAQGIVALGMGDTKKVSALKRSRPAIWEPCKEAVEKFSIYARKLASFLEDELTSDMPGRLASAVPAVVSRAVCDWFFQRSLLDHDRLEKWWLATKEGLRLKGALWQALEEQEGLLLRRIEKGLDEIRLRRSRYSIYANFGGSEVEVLKAVAGSAAAGHRNSRFEESLVLLATVVSEMHSRLKQIRDSAMWHIVDRAQGLHQELSLEDDVIAPSPWPTVGSDEGTDALLEAVVNEDVDAHGSLIDSALEVRRRLDGLLDLIADLRDSSYLQGSVAGANVCPVLSHIIQLISELNEDLLVLLDEPTPATVDTWCRSWANISNSGGSSCEQLDEAMSALPLKKDSDLKYQDREARKRWLRKMRGLCVLVGSGGSMRMEVVAPLMIHGTASPSSPMLRSRRESRRGGAETPALSVQDLELDILSLSTPPSPRHVALEQSGRFGESVLEGAARPGTASTACEDESASAKLADGKLISMRPNSASLRLPPLRQQSGV
mmetsp:Transcript_48026/g.112170  ORF Transcript_48026/g.112170 Transcript_48026/m.112170 type:complete len:635 (+) Transcript_48026:87-1991(+)